LSKQATVNADNKMSGPKQKHALTLLFPLMRAFAVALPGAGVRGATAIAAAQPEYTALLKEIDRLHFTWIRLRFNTRRGILRQRSGSAAAMSLTKFGLLNLILPTLLLTLVLAVDHLPATWGERFRIPVVHVNTTVLLNVAAVIAQVCVVIAGLYYAAMSVVLSNAYRQTGEALYALVNEYPYNGLFLRASIWIAVYALEVIGVATFGITGGIWTTVALLGIASIDLLAFLQAGRRAFDLFNPRHLLSAVSTKLQLEVEAVERGSGETKEEQDVHRRQATLYLDALSDVSRLCSKEDGSTVDVVCTCTGLLAWYGQRRSRIDPDSLWFERSSHYQSWFEADYLDVDLSLRTGRELDESHIDRSWLERRLVAILSPALETTLRRYRLSELQEVLLGAFTAVQSLANVYAFEELAAIVAPMATRLLQTQSSDARVEGLEYRLGFGAAQLLTFAALGFVYRIKDLTSRDIHRFMNGAINQPMFPEVHEMRLEFENGWKLEKAAEGRLVTTKAFARAVLSTEFMSRILGFGRSLASFAREQFGINPQQDAQSLRTAGYLAGFFEVVTKLHLVAEEIRSLEERICQPAQSEETPLRSEPLRSLDAEIIALRTDALASLATVALDFVGVDLKDDVPKFTEAAYHRLAMYLYDAIAAGDDVGVTALVAPLFRLAQAIVTSSLSDPANRQLVGTFIAADMFELCAYAMVYDRLSRGTPPTWPILRDALENTLAQSCEALRVYAVLASAGADILQAPHRSMQRHEWSMRLNDRLRERGILGYRYGMEPRADDVETSGDWLLDALVSTTEPRFDLLTVFYAVYLLDQHPEALSERDEDTRLLHDLVRQNEPIER
jgi:hypothetical protein